jgi:hypothetical protein
MIQTRQFYIKGILHEDIRFDAKIRLQKIYLAKGVKKENIDYPNLLNTIFL